MLTDQQRSALKAELTNDPNGLGNAPLVAAGNDGELAAKLNAVGVGAAYSIYKKEVTVKQLLAAFTPAEYAALSAQKTGQLSLLFAGSGGTLDAADANTRSIVTSVLAGSPNTVTQMATVIKRQGSRAEVLFGDGAVLSPADVESARRS